MRRVALLLSRPSRRAGLLARHVATGLLTLLLISIVAFGMMSIRTPEDIARKKFGPQITEAQIEAFAQDYGLDRPVFVRYLDWLRSFVRGDMGSSFVTDTAVSMNVIPRFERTLLLASASLLIALPIALALGVYQARRAGRWSDVALSVGSVVIAALPEFIIGIGLLFLFAVELRWLPVESATALTFASSFGEQAKAYVLPAATLVLAMIPHIARISRSAMREALGAQYTQAAVLRGLPPRTVIWDHALRNAGGPLVNAVAINIVYLLGGVIVVEWVFAFPGIGQGLVQATSTSDASTVQAIAVLLGAMFIVVSTTADCAVAYLNPRLKSAQ